MAAKRGTHFGDRPRESFGHGDVAKASKRSTDDHEGSEFPEPGPDPAFVRAAGGSAALRPHLRGADLQIGRPGSLDDLLDLELLLASEAVLLSCRHTTRATITCSPRRNSMMLPGSAGERE